MEALIASADVRNEVTGKARSGEFFAAVQAHRRPTAVSAAELDMNKRYVAGGYLIANQLQGCGRRILGQQLAGRSADRVPR